MRVLGPLSGWHSPTHSGDRESYQVSAQRLSVVGNEFYGERGQNEISWVGIGAVSTNSSLVDRYEAEDPGCVHLDFGLTLVGIHATALSITVLSYCHAASCLGPGHRAPSGTKFLRGSRCVLFCYTTCLTSFILSSKDTEGISSTQYFYHFLKAMRS